jgi:hypothetical protein
MQHKPLTLAAGIAAATLIVPAAALADKIDFEDFANAAKIDGVPFTVAGTTATFSSDEGQGVFAYDTAYPSPRFNADPDLIAPFYDSAYRPTETNAISPGIVAIIRDNKTNQLSDRAGGGTIRIEFAAPVFFKSAQILDTSLDKGGPVFFKFFNGTGFADRGTVIESVTAQRDADSDRAPNWYENLSFDFGAIGAVQYVEVDMTGVSGALSEIHVSPVPIPAAAWLFGSALVGMAGIGYRRSRKA